MGSQLAVWSSTTTRCCTICSQLCCCGWLNSTNESKSTSTRSSRSSLIRKRASGRFKNEKYYSPHAVSWPQVFVVAYRLQKATITGWDRGNRNPQNITKRLKKQIQRHSRAQSYPLLARQVVRRTPSQCRKNRAPVARRLVRVGEHRQLGQNRIA